MNGNNRHMVKPVTFGDQPARDISSWFVPVDQWDPEPQDQILRTGKGCIFFPVRQVFNITDPTKENLDVFIIGNKRCYNGDIMRTHMNRYVNYFEKFYDQDHELLFMIAKIKCNIDTIPSYTAEQFRYDVERMILSPSILVKAMQMNEDNYLLKLDDKKYKNEKNPSLIYSDRHAKTILWMSLLMNFVIPLAVHFIYIKNLPNANDFLLWIYEPILNLTSIDIVNKLYETSSSNVNRSAKKHERLWGKQDIRGKDPVTHSIESDQTIILNIMPKYNYESNIISFNYTSINKNIALQVVGIRYEYDYIPLSSSIRDSDNNSVFDKYESYATKANEGLFLANKVASEDTMKKIELMYGPFSNEEVDHYMRKLDDGNGNVINDFQKTLVFNLFYKYFGDTVSINNINKIAYVKLIIAASRLLKAHNMVVMPYIISSKIVKLQHKKSINKKEQARLENAAYFQKVRQKYKSDKIEAYILELMATITASKFQLIDFYDKDLDGKITEFSTDLIYDEISMYISLI